MSHLGRGPGHRSHVYAESGGPISDMDALILCTQQYQCIQYLPLSPCTVLTLKYSGTDILESYDVMNRMQHRMHVQHN